jgi:hypothetical protein
VALSACKSDTTRPNNGVTATVSFCTDNAPIWLAVQDGSSAWKQVTATSGNTYTFQLTSSRAGVAYVTQTANNFTTLSVLYATTSELTSSGGITLTCTATNNKTVGGSVAGLGASAVAVVSLGPSRTNVSGAAGQTTFQLQFVPTGPHDLVAARTTSSTGQTQVTTMIVRRGLDPAAGSTLPVLDFGSSEAFTPATANLTISGLGNEAALTGGALVTADRSNAFYYFDAGSTAATRPYYGLPAAQLASGDLHELFVTTGTRSAILYVHSVADRTVTLGSALGAPTITTAATTPYLRLRAQLPQQTEYNRVGEASYTQNMSGTFHTVTIFMTMAYAAAATSGLYDLVIPDLSGVTGFSAVWALQPGVSTRWNAIEVGGTFLLGFQRPTDGASIVTATQSGTITSP